MINSCALSSIGGDSCASRRLECRCYVYDWSLGLFAVLWESISPEPRIPGPSSRLGILPTLTCYLKEEANEALLD
jgi:hypothetical protein